MKRRLQGKGLVALALLLGLIFHGSAFASHTMGADLTYQCLGGNTYKITLSFYRDCIGIAAPTNPFVSINSSSCGQSLGVTCYPRAGTGQEVTPACSSSVTTCNGGPFTGIQEWVYDGIITLPAQCTDWIFGYSLCCRNAAITTINTPNSNTFYIYATLNNTITPHNSSPTFSNKPVPFLCKGQQFCFNHGAYDADGDSLVYSLITPRQSVTTTVNYISPYNASNPLNSVPATTFNTSTGDFCMTPQALEVTVMAVLVKEYRNGVLIGSVERDLQLTVMNCANDLPTLTGINGTNVFNMTICANQPTCFNIFSSDPDSGQNLTVEWNYGIGGATFNSSAASHPTGTFCWTPDTSAIGNSYTFTATVTDDACPYFGSQTYSYTVNVIGITVSAGPDQAVACSDIATLTATASGGSGTYTYLWSNGSTMQHITVGAGTYWVTANDGSCSATDTVNVITPFIPVASFTSTTPGCFNMPVNFYDNSTPTGGLISSWFWNFGDGDSSSLQNPVHTYAGPGTYNVTLIIQNTLGCVDSITIPVVIAAPPVTDFTWSATCVNTIVNFKDLSTGSPSTWNWSFGDGTFSILQDPSHTYTTPGNYTVSLISGNSGGCVDTMIHVITVHPLPLANAGADNTICSGGQVTLTATGGQTYFWSPGGQTTQVITITPGGSTTEIVTVTDTNGCVATDSVNLIVNPLPVVNAGADQATCSGNTITLNANGALTYSWTPGGSSSSTITVSPTTSTTYIVTGTDANGCSSSDTVNVNIFSLPTANAGPDVDICHLSGTTLTATGGISYVWSPGGSTNATIIVNPSSTQSYHVTVTDSNGCFSTDTVVVNVHANPVINLQSIFLCAGSSTTIDAGNPGSSFQWSNGDSTEAISITSGGIYSVTVTDSYGCSAAASCNVIYDSIITINLGNVSFCQGDSVILDAGYSGLQYSWSPGGQTTQTIYINSSGTYGVSVTDTAGCSGSINITAFVNPLPAANFSSTSACLGNAINFTDGSSITSGSITGWRWDFGDGTTSMLQNPSHIYLASNNYSVTLTVTSATGCISSVTHTVTVNPLPVADFSVSDICLGNLASFTDLSTVSTGNIVAYSWNFGDGFTSIIENPLHNYGSAGNYTINLQVVTAGGCIQSVSHNIIVHPDPAASFSAPPVCLGNATAFSNTSGISTGSITGVLWDFNDTHTSTQFSPSNTYVLPGTYAVKLIVTSSYGCTDTIINNVTVNPLPVANAGADQSICRGDQTTLTASGGISYSWSPGGMTTSNVTVSPNSTKTYTVTVTDSNGCASTDAVKVKVNGLPNANAGANQSTCFGNSVTLNGSGGIGYLWSPGGMTTGTVIVNPPSTTNYILTVTDANGCIDMDTVGIVVHPTPVVTAGPDQEICKGSTTAITAQGASTYQWNPIGMTTAMVLVTPLTNSTYTVIGTDIYGCVSSDTINVAVNPVPIINLYPTFICDGSSTTLDAGNPGSTYDWSSGESSETITVSDSGIYSVVVINADGCPAFASTTVTKGGGLNSPPTNYSVCAGQTATLNAGNPGCTYNWTTGDTTQVISVNTAGTYLVTITDTNGCSATLKHIVTVNPYPTATFACAPVCLGNPMAFNGITNAGAGTIQNILWDFGDTYSASTLNASHTYASPGSFQVSFTIENIYGCSTTYSGQVNVNPLPVASFSSNISCQNANVVFNNLSSISSGSISAWNWDFGDGSSSTQIAPSHNYAAPGNYTATLTAQSNYGCSNTVSKNVTVLPAPSAAFNTSNDCAENIISFVNNSASNGSAITSYQWSFGNGNTSTAFQPSIQYPADGTYPVQLITTSANGCSDTALSTITIFPLPAANFSATPVCSGSPVTIQNNSSVSNGTLQNYYWSFGDNSSSTLYQPEHIYSSDGSYTITMIASTSQGCRDTISESINIYPLPQPSFTGQDVCYGNNINFTNSSSISYGHIISWLWNFGNGTSSTASAPSLNYTTPGTYNVILTAISDQGCVASSNSNINVFPVPVASFSTTDVCYGSGTLFENHSTIDGGGNFYSNWSYSDGDSSISFNPVHNFSNAGNYYATLVVTSQNGCSDQITQGLTVHRLPVARFTAPDNCLGSPITFTNYTISQEGNITSTLWGFGDGTYSFNINPTHIYSDSGSYNVDLVSITSFGCMGNYSDTVSVFSHPTIVIQMNNACAGTPVQISGTSNQNNGTSYQWTLNNGYSSASSSFNYTFPSAGNYNVTLTATNSNGCSGTQTNQLVIYPVPVPEFSSNETCLSSQTFFNNHSTISTGSINSYSWNFGDNQQSSQYNPVHIYSAPGNYNAMLSVVSNHGCVSNVARQVVIHPSPLANFTAGLQGCSPVNAGFNETSSISSGTINSWLWNFGDGNVSTNQHPHHMYDQTGTYDVTLTVVSDFGCQSSITQANAIIVFPGPTADFIADPMVTDIDNPIVHFQNQSQNYSSYQWSFGDGTFTTTDINPTHTFSDSGTYTAKLITLNNFGCRDTIMKKIEVKLHSTLFIANCFTPNGDGNNDFFRPYYTNMKEIQVWIFDRWGKLLTSWNGLDGSWDGYYQGRKCQSDTYVYKIAGTGLDGVYSEWVGHVSIIY